jgi:hypothetical protein
MTEDAYSYWAPEDFADPDPEVERLRQALREASSRLSWASRRMEAKCWKELVEKWANEAEAAIAPPRAK